jgi:hypothetical protein
MQTTNNRDTDTLAPGELIPFGVKFEEPSKKIFLPLCHNGSCDIKATFASCLIPGFSAHNIQLDICGDSHAGRQCQKMANNFLATDATHLLIIDCDIVFSPVHIKRILSHDLPIVAGLYPKKEPTTPPCCCGFNDGTRQVTEDLVEVRRVGRGFILIAREVFERMKEENGGHAKRYHNHGRVEWEFFESGVVTGDMSCYEDDLDEQGNPKREWLSEDWFFCERARALGYRILVDTRIALGHEGTFLYEFDMKQLKKMAPESWRDIEGWFDFEDVYQRIAKHLAAAPFRSFVEVGAWMGKSIAYMTTVAPHDALLCAVDTFKGSPEEDVHKAIIDEHGGDLRKVYDGNLAALGITNRVTTFQNTSLEASAKFAPGTLDAVFIDAAHTFDSVKEDIEAWLPKVKSGGILAGHDYGKQFTGVKLAVDAVLGTVEVMGSCWYFTKP